MKTCAYKAKFITDVVSTYHRIHRSWGSCTWPIQRTVQSKTGFRNPCSLVFCQYTFLGPWLLGLELNNKKNYHCY